MTETNHSMRALWPTASLLFALCAAPSCVSESEDSDAFELDDASEALTQAEYDCEWEKRECFIAADCDAAQRDACESVFRACRAPVRDERARVRELCRAERDVCESLATSDAELHACHIAEHECKLPVDPPEAICHVEALRCSWDARADEPDAAPRRARHGIDHACHEEERACKESLRLDRADLPVAPKCEPAACDPRDPAPLPPDITDHVRCELDKRECLLDAGCDEPLRAACESAFRACEEPVRAERRRVHALCHAERESCEAVAVDDASHHACHIAEHRCKLPVDPPEAICHLEALECRWAAYVPGVTPPPGVPHAGPSPAEHACHEAERECVESRRVSWCRTLPPACAP